MHLMSLGILRFAEYMSAVYIEEEFGELYQPEDNYEYYRRQVTDHYLSCYIWHAVGKEISYQRIILSNVVIISII
jgi:hypothetical protein